MSNISDKLSSPLDFDLDHIVHHERSYLKHHHHNHLLIQVQGIFQHQPILDDMDGYPPPLLGVEQNQKQRFPVNSGTY